MVLRAAAAFAILFLALFRGPASALPAATSQDDENKKIAAAAIHGPSEVSLHDIAFLKLPAGEVFFPPSAAAMVVARLGNAVRPDLAGLVIGGGGDWMVVVEYVSDGHIPNAKPDELNAERLLARLQQRTSEDQRRHDQGLVEILRAARWIEIPRYDSERHQLTSALEYQTLDPRGVVVRSSVNRVAVAMGRSSHIVLNLVTQSADGNKNNDHLSELLAGLHFAPGYRYEDFDPSKDSVADYELSQLIVE